MKPSVFERHITHLRHRLSEPLPGTKAQFTMAPVFRQNADLADIRDKPCREAAVLALLFPMADTPSVILTVRRGHLNQHAGQVSFPGGRREPGEELLNTALREAEEEIRLETGGVEVLGTLTPLYIPPSNFCVHPFVGVLPYQPSLTPQDEEVASILHVPITHLKAPETRQREDWSLRGQKVNVPFFSVEGHKVWGATAMMLAELLTLFPLDPLNVRTF